LDESGGEKAVLQVASPTLLRQSACLGLKYKKIRGQPEESYEGREGAKGPE